MRHLGESMCRLEQRLGRDSEHGAVSTWIRDLAVFWQLRLAGRVRRAIRGWRWPKGFDCPDCQGTWRIEFRRQGRLYFQCGARRCQCSLLSGTVFESSELPPPKWFLAMHAMTRATDWRVTRSMRSRLNAMRPALRRAFFCSNR
jgi:hypothetical protein